MGDERGDRQRIGRTLAESEPYFAEPAHPGEDAPNVVIVLLDDTGFAQLGCYGSDIDTPHIDALAANGLQFTNFHVTPLCSPTRAALLTGRSNHAVGMRSLSNFRTGFPNQMGHITNNAGTVAEVMGAAGYTTLAVGKWHLAPMESCSAAGPFDQWPLGRGFDRFYGFLDGETDQFHPSLVADNHRVEPPAGPADGYHLSEDLVDRAIGMIADAKGVRPDRPFLLYLAFGATHAPHQAPPEYLAKYRGAFDDGWDQVRQRWYDKQRATGVIPEHTRLAPHNPGVRPWDRLTSDEQTVAARLQEAFAAFLDHTDVQIGRLVEALERLGELDNTILVVLADNGASQEGGANGVMHEMKWFNGIEESVTEALEHLDEIGGPHSHTNYPWGWAQCGNTPFRWYKQNTHEGGVHVPMVLHWPDGITPDNRGGRRDQFVFVSDIVPTIFDLAGLTPPDEFRGVPQLPVTGHSFVSVLHDTDAAPVNTVQYFELNGSRAIVAGGHKAVTKHVAGDDYDTEPWELYDLDADPSECDDLADRKPELLAELVALWWEEAERNGVFPLDDRTWQLFAPRLRDRSPHRPDRRYVYRPPMTPLPAQASGSLGGRATDLRARITVTERDAGVLYATGTSNAGVSVFIQNRHLVVDYNAFGDHTILESAVPVPAGDAEVIVRLRRSEGLRGQLAIEIDDAPAGRVELPLMMRIISSIGPSIGQDHGSAVSERYSAPNPFTGTLHELVVQTGADRSTASAVAAARAEMARQ